MSPFPGRPFSRRWAAEDVTDDPYILRSYGRGSNHDVLLATQPLLLQKPWPIRQIVVVTSGIGRPSRASQLAAAVSDALMLRAAGFVQIHNLGGGTIHYLQRHDVPVRKNDETKSA